VTTISIAESLWIEETHLGATLNFRSGSTSQDVLFRVGISHDSLRACYSALAAPSCFWTIRDGSFSIHGDEEGITLTFSANQNGVHQAGLSLYGEEMAAFKTAMFACACRRETALN
jgi:hypothetical protein